MEQQVDAGKTGLVEEVGLLGEKILERDSKAQSTHERTHVASGE